MFPALVPSDNGTLIQGTLPQELLRDILPLVSEVPTREQRERARLHRALSDPVRVAIVDELTLSDRTPGELRSRLEIESNLLAHHLDALEAAGVVTRSVSHGDRRRRYVHLSAEPLPGLVDPTVIETSGVVFICTHNSARSQLAAALWGALSRVPARSAGTRPASRVHPGAVASAERCGLDLSMAEPRGLAAEELNGRLVVTVCDMAHEELSGLESSTQRSLLHWSIPDPAEAATAESFDAALELLRERTARLAPHVVGSRDDGGGP